MTITHHVTVKQHGYTNKSILMKTKLGRDIIYADKNKIGDGQFLCWLETGGKLFILSKYNMGRNSTNLDQKQIGEGLYHLLLHNNYIGSCSEKIVKKEKPEVNMSMHCSHGWFPNSNFFCYKIWTSPAPLCNLHS